MHGLPDGCVSAADLNEAVLQCVVTDHHREQNSHLIISVKNKQKGNLESREPPTILHKM